MENIVEKIGEVRLGSAADSLVPLMPLYACVSLSRAAGETTAFVGSVSSHWLRFGFGRRLPFDASARSDRPNAWRSANVARDSERASERARIPIKCR